MTIDSVSDMTFAPKGLPPEACRLDSIGVARLGYNVAAGDLPLPAVTLSRSAVNHNIKVMARWCAERGVLLAPHGKTTMSPDLFQRQLAAGAWGITVTTARQAEVAAAAGARRLVVASELVNPVELRSLASLAVAREIETYVFVDSEYGLRQLESAAVAAPGHIAGLVEMGFVGGRTGVRDQEALYWLLDAFDGATVPLAGVSAFEGIIRISRKQEPGAQMSGFLEQVAGAVTGARERGLLAEGAILSAGGSSAFDMVVRYLGDLVGPIVLRSGCYVTHDHGLYAMQSPLQEGNVANLAPDHALQPAMRVWAHVISTPEPGLAVAGFGRRDAGNDAHMPCPLDRVLGPAQRQPVAGWTVTKMWDQHARMDAEPGAMTLNVGDVLTFGISHPCTTIDKWRVLIEIDDLDNVVGSLETYF